MNYKPWLMIDAINGVVADTFWTQGEAIDRATKVAETLLRAGLVQRYKITRRPLTETTI